MNILVLESSTSSAKALLYHGKTGQVEQLSQEYGGSGGDPEAVLRLTAALGRRLCGGRPVSMIALCSAWHSVFLLDRDAKPVTPVYNWTSTMAAACCVELRKDPDYVRDYYQRTGCMVNATYPYFKLMALRQQGWDLREHLVMGQGSYNTFRLTGQRVTTDCMESGTGMMNIHSLAYDPDLLAALDLAPEQLSRIIPVEQTLPLSEEGARLLGLEPGVPVIAACSDGGLNQLGVGADSQGVMTFSVGTSAAIRLTVADPILPETPGVWCYRAPGFYLSGAATAGACNCVDWFKAWSFPDQSFAEVEAECAMHPDTPIFLPFLFGERCPGWRDDARGVFADISPQHGAHSMYRAVLEGTLFGVYHCYRLLLEQGKQPPPRIILSGGIVNSPVWTRICADIFGSDMEIPPNGQSSLMGGVALALRLLGREEELAPLFQGNRRVSHRPEEHARYAGKFQDYLFWYDKLHGGAREA